MKPVVKDAAVAGSEHILFPVPHRVLKTRAVIHGGDEGKAVAVPRTPEGVASAV
jgi:hypothetical protein